MKTYHVLREGWLTNARGHGRHYLPYKQGKKQGTIELTDTQAEYLLKSGQIGEGEDSGAGNDDSVDVAKVEPVTDLPHVGLPQDVDTKDAHKGTTKARRIV